MAAILVRDLGAGSHQAKIGGRVSMWMRSPFQLLKSARESQLKRINTEKEVVVGCAIYGQ